METDKPIEVVYTKAKLGKRLIAHFFDISILAICVAFGVTISNQVVTSTGLYKQKEAAIAQIRNDSGLYVDNTDIVTYAETHGADNVEKKEIVRDHINLFYHNSTYFADETIINQYNERKKARTDIFVINEFDEPVEKSDAGYAAALYEFYKSEYNNISLGFLLRNTTYFYLVRYQFWSVLIQTISLITLFFTIFYLIFPLFIFKRGRQTIGMKLEKIGLISVRADNIQTGVYIGRFFFMYFIFIPINFVSFGIPSIISISMSYFSKRNCSLPNYVFNDYMVDVSNQQIYLNAYEREESLIKLQQISIENKDLRLK